MSEKVKVTSENYTEMCATRDELENVINEMYEVIAHMQKTHTRIDHALQDYDEEQAALDV